MLLFFLAHVKKLAAELGVVIGEGMESGVVIVKQTPNNSNNFFIDTKNITKVV